MSKGEIFALVAGIHGLLFVGYLVAIDWRMRRNGKDVRP
jgi:hypothetical protein